MEISVNPPSVSSIASNGYGKSHFVQGSSDLEPFNPTSAPPVAPVATDAPNPLSNPEQAAQLRALLASHLSGNGNSNISGAEHPPLEALLDVLYSMTLSAGGASVPSSEVVSDPAGANLAAPAPISSVVPDKMPEAVRVPEIAPVVAGVSVPQFLEEQSIEAGGEPYTFAIPSASQSSAPAEIVTNSVPVSVVESREATQPAPLIVETPPAPPIAEIPPAPILEMRQSEPVVDSPKPLETTPITPVTAAFVTEETSEGELDEAVNASTPVALPVEMRLPSVLQDAADKVTFSLTTAKSSASLQLPVLPNLSLLVLEQRADEIIIKIHLAL